MRQAAAFSPGWGLRFGLPVVMVVATLLLADLLRGVFPGSGVFLLLLAPVLVAAIALGAQSGLITLALGGAGAWLLVVLHGHPWLTATPDLLRVIPYLFLGGFIVLVAAALRGSVGASAAPRAVSSTALIEALTPREAEVLGLAATGLTTDEIGGHLYLSRNTR